MEKIDRERRKKSNFVLSMSWKIQKLCFFWGFFVCFLLGWCFLFFCFVFEKAFSFCSLFHEDESVSP